MKCPSCRSTDLAPIRTTDGAFDLDACPACKGVWFDAGELSGALAISRGAQTVPGHAFQALDRSCPRCSAPLFEHCFPGTEVLVDACRQCEGVWLDGGEWQQIRDALRNAPRITCPKCQATQTGKDVCTACGVVFEKYREQQMEPVPDPAEQPAWTLESIFKDAHGYRTQQRLEWMEILSPFELRNRYDATVLASRNFHGFVEEHSNSWINVLTRQLLGTLRPATLFFEDEYQNTILKMRKPFRVYFHQLDVSDAEGVALGSVRRRFHLLRSNYEVLDGAGQVAITITGPIFMLPFAERVFTFERNGREVGSLTKKWKGILKEYFSDADAFRTQIDRSLPVTDKVLLFCATLLIDFGNFEQNESSPMSLADLLD